MRGTHYYLEGLGVVLGDTVRFVVRRQLLILEVFYESLDIIHFKILHVSEVNVFLEILVGRIENSECRNVLSVDC